MFQTKVVEEIKKHILFSMFFSPKIVPFMRMWKKVLQWDRPQTTIWRMRSACWITKVTYTLTVCNIYCFSTATIVARTRLNVT